MHGHAKVKTSRSQAGKQLWYKNYRWKLTVTVLIFLINKSRRA